MGLKENLQLCRECMDLVTEDIKNWVFDHKLVKWSREEIDRRYNHFDVDNINIIVFFDAFYEYEPCTEIRIPLRDLE